MSQSVVNRDDITVTSGAVFRADNELKRELIDSTPIGIIHAYVSENPPNDTWLLCRGQAFSGSKYPLLAKIFPDLRVPDLRGVALRGLDAGKNHDPNRELLSYQEDMLKRHRHTLSESAFVPTVNTDGGKNPYARYDGVGKQGNDGGYFGGAETRMKNVAVNFIIKAK